MSPRDRASNASHRSKPHLESHSGCGPESASTNSQRGNQQPGGLTFSIIIPVKNNAGTLPALIESAWSQLFRPAEVVVVDGSSIDETPKIASKMGARLIRYESVGDERSYARNLGANQSTGSVLVFVDSDMELSSEVLIEAAKAIEAGADAVVFPEVNLGQGLIGKIRSWERRAVSDAVLLTFARAMRREVFQSAGGFDKEILGFEDIDLQATLIERGFRIARIGAKIWHHEEQLTMVSYLAKRRYYSLSSTRYRDKHPVLSKSVFSPFERLKVYVHGVHSVKELPLMGAVLCLRALELV